jgi:sugar phosphate isomerase/epimerase
MELRLFKTLWGHTTGLDAAIAECRAKGFDGLEGPSPIASRGRAVFGQRLADEGLAYIAEICTAGSYVPRPHTTVAEHLASFREQAAAAAECAPLFVTVLAGRDAWSLAECVEFFGEANAFAKELDVAASFETHRSRALFHPWDTRDLLQQLPELRLTCDFSHWCCVCERLVLDEEPELLALFAARAHHIHARVGYDQGPQVPHPAAPEFRPALEAHERWWSAIWDAQERAGQAVSTMTPEFGPDGYLHTLPFTAEPVADLVEINHWMALRQREQFAARRAATAG